MQGYQCGATWILETLTFKVAAAFVELALQAGVEEPELEFAHLPGHEEIDEEEMLKMELEKLKTGEDAIAFFAKNG